MAENAKPGTADTVTGPLAFDLPDHAENSSAMNGLQAEHLHNPTTAVKPTEVEDVAPARISKPLFLDNAAMGEIQLNILEFMLAHGEPAIAAFKAADGLKWVADPLVRVVADAICTELEAGRSISPAAIAMVTSDNPLWNEVPGGALEYLKLAAFRARTVEPGKVSAIVAEWIKSLRYSVELKLIAQDAADTLPGIQRGEREAFQRLSDLGRAAVELTPKARIVASPFVWIAPEHFPQRRWLFGRHVVAGLVSVTAGPGGIGKSSHAAVDCICVATGKSLFRDHPVEHGIAWYVGLEDPLEEHRRRFTAAALLHNIKPADFQDRLFLDDASQGFVVARKARDGVLVAEPVVSAMINQIKAKGITALTIDPFVACHEVSENDNGEINQVADIWKRIARETGCGIDLQHHVRKSNGNQPTADDVRGGGAIVNSSRSTRLLIPMSTSEAQEFGVSEPWRYLRVEFAKANLGPRGGPAAWREIMPIDFKNGSNGHGDHVAALQAWSPPEPPSIASLTQLQAIKDMIAGGTWRADNRADEWVGLAVAQVLGLDLRDAAVKKRVANAVDDWIKEGHLRVQSRKDPKQRKDFDFVEVASSNATAA